MTALSLVGAPSSSASSFCSASPMADVLNPHKRKAGDAFTPINETLPPAKKPRSDSPAEDSAFGGAPSSSSSSFSSANPMADVLNPHKRKAGDAFTPINETLSPAKKPRSDSPAEDSASGSQSSLSQSSFSGSQSPSPLPTGLNSKEHQYTVISRLGAGSYALVFKVQNEAGEFFALKRSMALKHAHTAAQNELIMLANYTKWKVQHTPYLIDSFNSPPAFLGDYAPPINLVMTLAPGKTLNELSSETFTPQESLHILKQLLEHLQIPHDKGIAHRDLCLRNVLYHRESGKITVIDLGLAHDMQKPPASSLLDSHTFQSLAPEIVLGAKSTTSVDLWNAGCILYSLLTGDEVIQNPEESIETEEEYVSCTAHRLPQPSFDFLITCQAAKTFFTIDEERREAVLKSKITSHLSPIKEVIERTAKESSWSEELKNQILELLHILLSIDPKERLTVPQLLKHPLFQEKRDSSADSKDEKKPDRSPC